MNASQTAVPRSTRGRVVMLVDNGVEGDSRVQKAARSAAEAGWEVVLLGRSPGSLPQPRCSSMSKVWMRGGRRQFIRREAQTPARFSS